MVLEKIFGSFSLPGRKLFGITEPNEQIFKEGHPRYIPAKKLGL
jgi:hypothetical protein